MQTPLVGHPIPKKSLSDVLPHPGDVFPQSDGLQNKKISKSVQSVFGSAPCERHTQILVDWMDGFLNLKSIQSIARAVPDRTRSSKTRSPIESYVNFIVAIERRCGKGVGNLLKCGPVSHPQIDLSPFQRKAFHFGKTMGKQAAGQVATGSCGKGVENLWKMSNPIPSNQVTKSLCLRGLSHTKPVENLWKRMVIMSITQEEWQAALDQNLKKARELGPAVPSVLSHLLMWHLPPFCWEGDPPVIEVKKIQEFLGLTRSQTHHAIKALRKLELIVLGGPVRDGRGVRYSMNWSKFGVTAEDMGAAQ